MSTVTFVSKKPAGGLGNFNYEYTCTCAAGEKKPNIIVTSANDIQARQLAQLECNDTCSELSVNSSSITLTEPIEFLMAQDTSEPSLTVTANTVSITPQPIVSLLPCTRFFDAGANTVGIRNNCAECVIVSISWDRVGVARYRVPGYSEVYIQYISAGRIIGEQPC